MPAKADILARLQRDILSLQGYRTAPAGTLDAIGLERINQSFPDQSFPLAAVHEFFCNGEEEVTASGGFISGILSSMLYKGGVALWVNTSGRIFPPALKTFGIQPHQVIFLHLKKEAELSWAVEEALKCKALAAVVGEMQELSFTGSRRFQLAIEKSGVSCFVVRRNPKNISTTATARWKIEPLQSRVEEGLPGVGHPCWKVNLLKVRNGKPGTWDMEWTGNRFRHLPKLAAILPDLKKKTG